MGVLSASPCLPALACDCAASPRAAWTRRQRRFSTYLERPRPPLCAATVWRFNGGRTVGAASVCRRSSSGRVGDVSFSQRGQPSAHDSSDGSVACLCAGTFGRHAAPWPQGAGVTGADGREGLGGSDGCEQALLCHFLGAPPLPADPSARRLRAAPRRKARVAHTFQELLRWVVEGRTS